LLDPEVLELVQRGVVDLRGEPHLLGRLVLHVVRRIAGADAGESASGANIGDGASGADMRNAASGSGTGDGVLGAEPRRLG
jgi:hypothetical protein